MTLAYVAPLYISRTTRPSPSLSRDAPSVIRARIRAVTLSCLGGTVAVLLLILNKGSASLGGALHYLGWWPISLGDIIRSLFLTAILFTGPLFERGIAEGEWRDWVRGRQVSDTLRGWIGWRNFVAGPVTEEIMFRSIIIAVHLLAQFSSGRIVFLVPLYFGIAHLHHFYEFRLTHPDTSIYLALLRSVVQFTYTSIFGWYANFLYLRTGSLPAVILVHSFCNWCGLPRLWGRIESGVPLVPPTSTFGAKAKEDDQSEDGTLTPGALGIGWTVAYYGLLVVGAVGFYFALWPLTESKYALASF